MTTGEKIRAIRKERGFTQKELGERCGIAEPTIRRYELGKLNPKFETLSKIAKELRVPVYKLVGIENQIEIALNSVQNPKEATDAAHDILSSGDKEASIMLARAIMNRTREIVPDEALIASVNRLYSLMPSDQRIVIEIINILYEAELKDQGEE